MSMTNVQVPDDMMKRLESTATRLRRSAYRHVMVAAVAVAVVVVVVVVIEVIVAPWILSHPKLHRFSDYD